MNDISWMQGGHGGEVCPSTKLCAINVTLDFANIWGPIYQYSARGWRPVRPPPVHLLSTSCPPPVHLLSTWHHSHDKCFQAFFTALPFLCIILNRRTKTGETWEWGNFLAVCTWLSTQEVYCHQTMSHACFLITIRQRQSSCWSGHLTQFIGVSANTYLSYLVIDRWSPIINNVVWVVQWQ